MPYNQIYFVMNERRQNILNIQYNIQNSLVLKWDLRGLLNQQTYIRHLFIFNFKDQSFFKKAVNLIYSTMKTGDFFAFLARRNIFLQRSLDWFQKTSFGFESLRFKEFNSYSIQELIAGLQLVGEEASEYSTPLMVNIFTDQVEEIPQIKQCIQGLRKKGYFSFHVNFFAKFLYHDISTSTGFNCINITEESLEEASQIYKRLALESAVANIQMEIDCPEVQLTTRNDNIWETVDFGRVRRYLYGPSIHYKQDNVSFCREATRLGNNLIMVVLLKITLLSGKVLNSQKTLTINEENVRSYKMTRCDHREPRSTFQFSKTIRSKTQPFCSNSQIIMTKMSNSEKTLQQLQSKE